MNRRIAAIALASVALLGLSGCSGLIPGTSGANEGGAASGPDTQTVAEACATVSDKVSGVANSFQNFDVSTAADDPQAAIAIFTEAVDALKAAQDAVGNSEVREATTSIRDSVQATGDTLKKLLVDGDVTAVASIGTVSADVRASLEAFTALCNS